MLKTVKNDINKIYDIKIGRSSNVDKRIKQIQTGNPNKIILIQKYQCKDCNTVERMIHNNYKEKRLEGEWFNFTERDINECKELIQKFY